MALLIERKALGTSDERVARDLSEKMLEVQAAQVHEGGDASFEINTARAWIEEFADLSSRQSPITDVDTVDEDMETRAGVLRMRRYNAGRSHLRLVFVHGGGWVMGSIETHDHIARWLARETGGEVVSLGYALAPEHPFPTAVDQCRDALEHFASESRDADTALFVAGDSAGANIAAMAILRSDHATKQSITGFISIYGAYAPEMGLSSHKLYSDGRFGLSEEQMVWFWNLYAPHIPASSREGVTPLGHDLTDFPPTLCVATECDLLLDDTLALYAKLANACVEVSLCLWPRLSHGCLHFLDAVESVTHAARDIVRFIDAKVGGDVRINRQSLDDSGQGLHIGRDAASVIVNPPKPAGTASLVDVSPLFAHTRTRLYGSLAHTIATHIFERALAPNALLPREDRASAEYGVSRSAYREAIRTLAAKGLVHPIPKVGTRIAERASWQLLDPDVLSWYFESIGDETFVRQLFELRKILEPSAAALAAMRRSESELASLTQHLSVMASANPRTTAWMDATIAFHHAMLRASGNEALVSLWSPIRATLSWSCELRMKLTELQLDDDPVTDYTKVYEQIAHREPDKALYSAALLVDAALAETLSNLRRVNSTG